MMTQKKMPNHFWNFSYTSAFFLHNFLPNSQCLHTLPHRQLYSWAPSITTLYPFGAKAIVHIPATQKCHKKELRGTACRLLKPLMTGGWPLWDLESDRMIQSASVIFPWFQPLGISVVDPQKGSLPHILNSMTLGQVPTKSGN
ncbi:hypothetical protein O181_071399 [Austropuccinia psidii MF-1]|uniref:Uncharacterized protein n=1 Tax=Austropuccinia psidii MF-1 TaxID=1389203 RepID=A0A9Q3IAG1_9BASI|nr:hypothetical protein [Austropuccinia psidii MF-1]